MKKSIFIFAILLFLATQVLVSQTDNSINYEPGSSNYPGIKPGEVFLTVISTEYYMNYGCDDPHIISSTIYTFDGPDGRAYEVNFSRINWCSKRAGTTAYGSSGEVYSTLRPIFVSQEEWEKRNKNK
jgi:hypothetical protein